MSIAVGLGQAPFTAAGFTWAPSPAGGQAEDGGPGWAHLVSGGYVAVEQVWGLLVTSSFSAYSFT